MITTRVKSNEQLQTKKKKGTNCSIRDTRRWLILRIKIRKMSGLQERKLREGRACGDGGIGQNGREGFRGD